MPKTDMASREINLIERLLISKGAVTKNDIEKMSATISDEEIAERRARETEFWNGIKIAGWARIHTQLHGEIEIIVMAKSDKPFDSLVGMVQKKILRYKPCVPYVFQDFVSLTTDGGTFIR